MWGDVIYPVLLLVRNRNIPVNTLQFVPGPYRPGAGSVYLCGRDKKVWPLQVKHFCLLYANHHYWQLNSCTFGPGTLFKGAKNRFYLCETRQWNKLYGVVSWWCGIMNSSTPVTLDCTFAGTVTLFKVPKTHLFMRRPTYMWFSFPWS